MATVRMDNAVMYTVNNGLDWGTIVLRLGDRSVQVIADSSFGSYGHYWNACGEDPISFLVKIDRDYAMTKLSGYNYMELDRKRVFLAAKDDVIRARQVGALSKDEARELWDDIEHADHHVDGEEAQRYLWGHRLFSKVWEFPPAPRRVRPQCIGFWEYIWRPFAENLERLPPGGEA